MPPQVQAAYLEMLAFIENGGTEAEYSELVRARAKALFDEGREEGVRFDRYMKDLLRRLGVTADVDAGFFFQMWAAGRFAGFSTEEFWALTPVELCAVFELKANELDLLAGRAERLQRSKPGLEPHRIERMATEDQGKSSELQRMDCADRSEEPQIQLQDRASWLKERLHERSWNKHDLQGQGGPAHKTTQKILDGIAVRADVLEKVAGALSKKHGAVKAADIPQA
jgi:hypothetical protein